MKVIAHAQFAVLTVALACAVGWQAGALPVDEAKVLDTLKPGHPRLMLSNEDLTKLKEAYSQDETLRRYWDQVKEQADKAIPKPKLEHKLIGPRLLSVSRECLDRIYALALAYRWTGDKTYAEAAESNLLTVCAFADWNPSHFLDTAEMSHAVGVGYDWLFDYLSDESKRTIRKALIENGLKPGIDVYNSGKGWPTSDFNWNQVCNGGMIAGSLAIAETDPEYAKFIVPHAVASLPTALRSYDPDGAWMEGPSYWSYATRYTAYGICALDTALGTDFGLSNNPGLRVTAMFPNYATGPTGKYLNYADAGENGARRPLPCMFWLAKKFGQPEVSDIEHKVVGQFRADPEHVIWYTPTSGQGVHKLELDKWFRGNVDIAVMRSAWDDPNALFVGVKGGYNQVNHGHLDLGNFELDALGVRWARDLGSDDYNLPGYFDKKPKGKRWKYYRMRSASHNVPMLGEEDQDKKAVSKILDMDSKADSVRATIDLTDAYKKLASKATRDVALVEDRRAVVVRDVFKLKSPCDVLWGMTTDAKIDVQTNGKAVLTLGGKQLVATILSPKKALFSVESAEQQNPEKTNKGVSRLVVRLEKAKGKCTVAVLLAPVWDNGPVENVKLNRLK